MYTGRMCHISRRDLKFEVTPIFPTIINLYSAGYRCTLSTTLHIFHGAWGAGCQTCSRSPASWVVVITVVVVVTGAFDVSTRDITCVHAPHVCVHAYMETAPCCPARRFSAHKHEARWKNVKWWLVIAVANGSPTSRPVGRLSPLHVAAPPPGAASYQGA